VLSIYRFLASTIGPTIARLVLGRNPKTSNTLAERFGTEGLPDSLPPGRRVWLNAASVGETMAALPFVEEWRKRFPDDRILLTNTTVTGFTRVREKLGGAIAWHGYGPLDLPVTISRFLKRLNPDVYITVEAEAWPNLLADLGRAGVPRILINGRMTLANKRGLKRSITLAIWKLFDFISARSEKDYNAFLKLGIPNDRLAIGGEMKCDISFPVLTNEAVSAIQARYGIDKSNTWIAASTHEEEDDLTIRAHIKILKHHPDARLVLVPRRPERFEAVAEILNRSGLSYTRVSEDHPASDASVVLVDAMGKLLDFYQAGGLAVVCGSFFGPGVHNVLEPAAYGKPIVVGPRTFNTDIPERMVENGELLILDEPEQIGKTVIAWLSGENVPGKGFTFEEMAARAEKFSRMNNGASTKTLDLVEVVLKRTAR